MSKTHKGGKMSKYNGFSVGDAVICSGGYAGTVIRLCEWSDSMIEVRLSSGVVCIDASDAVRS